MNYVFGTFIVTTAVAVNLRKLSQMMDMNNTDGMFTTALSPTGAAPATHYISTGMVPAAYANAMGDPVRLFNIAQRAYADAGVTFPFTQTQVTNALSKCDVSDGTRLDADGNTVPESPFDAMARLGLQMIAGAS